MKTNKQIVMIDIAGKYKDLYDSFLRKGFTTEQAFQLLLTVVKQEKK